MKKSCTRDIIATLIIGIVIWAAIGLVLKPAPSHAHASELGFENKTNVIIDIDIAPDDVIAVLYLLKHTNISVRAITISCGETHVEIGARNILNLLDYLGFSDIPVAVGKSTPLQVNHTFPDNWRAFSDNFFNLNLPPTDLEPSSMNASELIVSIVKSSTTKIKLLAVGPLTNIAIALRSDPSIKDQIDGIFIMGGAVRVSGNLKEGAHLDPSLSQNDKAEWNIWIDPHAAEIVFESGVQITLIPLDATNMVPVTREFYERMNEVKHTPEAEIAVDLIEISVGLYFWDTLAAVTLTNQSMVTLEKHHIDVVTTNGAEIGWTRSIQGEQANAFVAMDTDTSEFENLLLKVMSRARTSPILTVLNITPAEIEPGNEVTITFSITNSDNQAFNYTATMQIGELILLIDVELEAYESKTVSRTITRYIPGDYNVTVDSLEGIFTVKPPELPTPPLPPILSNLTITQEEIELGDNVTIGLDIMNIDSQSFTYIVTMQIGELTLLVDVELEPYESKTVKRTITPDMVGDFNITVDGLTGSFTVKTPPKPAEFEFSDLRIFYPGIKPPEVERGQTVTVTVSIEAENVGELEGGRTVELKVEGVVVDSKGVTLEGGASATVLFELMRGEGTHEVEVEGFTESFTVNPKPSFWDKIPGFSYESIILGLVTGIFILWLLSRRKMTL